MGIDDLFFLESVGVGNILFFGVCVIFYYISLRFICFFIIIIYISIFKI